MGCAVLLPQPLQEPVPPCRPHPGPAPPTAPHLQQLQEPVPHVAAAPVLSKHGRQEVVRGRHWHGPHALLPRAGQLHGTTQERGGAKGGGVLTVRSCSLLPRAKHTRAIMRPPLPEASPPERRLTCGSPGTTKPLGGEPPPGTTKLVPGWLLAVLSWCRYAPGAAMRACICKAAACEWGVLMPPPYCVPDSCGVSGARMKRVGLLGCVAAKDATQTGRGVPTACHA